MLSIESKNGVFNGTNVRLAVHVMMFMAISFVYFLAVRHSNFLGTLEDHEDESTYLTLPLSSPSIKLDHGAISSIDDQSQSFTCSINIVHSDSIDVDEHPDEYILVGSAIPKTSDAEEKDATTKSNTAPAAPTNGHKRKSSSESSDEPKEEKKRQKMEVDDVSNDDDIEIIE